MGGEIVQCVHVAVGSGNTHFPLHSISGLKDSGQGGATPTLGRSKLLQAKRDNALSRYDVQLPRANDQGLAVRRMADLTQKIVLIQRRQANEILAVVARGTGPQCPQC